MAEATVDTNPATPTPDAAELARLAREFDLARMKQIGSYHFAMVTGALTMWGAAVTWFQATDWAIAWFAAIASALVAGFVIPSVVHEWGHLAGARLSGSVSPMFEKAQNHFGIFGFDMEKNDTRQFAWMSWGGILSPWLAVLGFAAFVPLGAAGAKVLLATLVAKAIAAGVFEVPVVQDASRSGHPGAELGKHARAGGIQRGRKIGTIAGVGCFVLLWLVV